MGDPLNENGQMVTLTERLMVSGGTLGTVNRCGPCSKTPAWRMVTFEQKSSRTTN